MIPGDEVGEVASKMSAIEIAKHLIKSVEDSNRIQGE